MFFTSSILFAAITAFAPGAVVYAPVFCLSLESARGLVRVANDTRATVAYLNDPANDCLAPVLLGMPPLPVTVIRAVDKIGALTIYENKPVDLSIDRVVYTIAADSTASYGI